LTSETRNIYNSSVGQVHGNHLGDKVAGRR